MDTWIRELYASDAARDGASLDDWAAILGVRDVRWVSGVGPSVSEHDLAWRSEPLAWQKRGLSQTATGYGARLTSSRKCFIAGKWRRAYVTCYSNVGVAWVMVKGQRVIVG